MLTTRLRMPSFTSVSWAFRQSDTSLPVPIRITSGAPPGVTARIAVEQGSAMGWERYVGPGGRTIGMRTFGASAPHADLQRKFGFTPEHIVAAVQQVLGRAGRVVAAQRRS